MKNKNKKERTTSRKFIFAQSASVTHMGGCEIFRAQGFYALSRPKSQLRKAYGCMNKKQKE